MKPKTIYIAIIIMMVLVLSSCNSRNTVRPGGAGKVSVYTSFYIMYDFAGKIAGDKAEIINMVPSGAEPHDWEPTPKDIAGLYHADLFIYNGCGMEGWADKVIESLNSPDLAVVETSRNIKARKAAEHEHNHNHDHAGDRYHDHDHGHLEENNLHSCGKDGYDPHVWLDPQNAKIQMEAIKDGLIQVDPTNRKYYEDNFEFYARKLDDLDRAYKKSVQEFTRREIVVSHEAFGYLCDAYGLVQIAIEGISGESEPTPAKMAQIIKFVKENDVKVIFFEELASPKVAETIARETGAVTDKLNPLEGLSEEDLKAGKDYFSVMEENLEALKRALGRVD
ncbi:MAG: zinc ABC transporter substrate-binding protein [Clostridiaceae bacterium]|jgi:zinc transport system substrate-binding protein|nr:zinc ABC transporter substrate-binding protein [Clostridiaceae bacterium]